MLEPEELEEESPELEDFSEPEDFSELDDPDDSDFAAVELLADSRLSVR